MSKRETNPILDYAKPKPPASSGMDVLKYTLGAILGLIAVASIFLIPIACELIHLGED